MNQVSISSLPSSPDGAGVQPVGPRQIYQVARDIRRAWGSKVNFAAAPYLDAMDSLGSASDSYGYDSAASIVLYFLGNARSFKGDAAKALKAELKQIVGVK